MKLINIQHMTSKNPEDGSLCVTESLSAAIQFDIKRVYYTYGVKEGIVRGHHAHKALEQVLVCIHGAIKVTLDYGNGNLDTILLDNPSVGLYVGPSVWRTMQWKISDSVLLVLASEHYNASDYIRDYNEFISWVSQERCQ